MKRKRKDAFYEKITKNKKRNRVRQVDKVNAMDLAIVEHKRTLWCLQTRLLHSHVSLFHSSQW